LLGYVGGNQTHFSRRVLRLEKGWFDGDLLLCDLCFLGQVVRDQEDDEGDDDEVDQLTEECPPSDLEGPDGECRGPSSPDGLPGAVLVIVFAVFGITL
jgi:hypothetical protein